MKYYTIPDGWIKKALSFEEEARKIIGMACHVSVYPATRGGCKAGYTWSKRFSIRFSNRVKLSSGQFYNHAGMRKSIIKYSAYNIEEFKRIWKRVKPIFDRLNILTEYIEIYRRSGLIPDRIEKSHTERVEKKFKKANVYKDKDEALNYLREIMTKYIRRYSKCPHCSNRGFRETILGFHCHTCHTTYNVEDGQWDMLGNFKESLVSKK